MTEKYISRKIREKWLCRVDSFECASLPRIPDLLLTHKTRGSVWLELKRVPSVMCQIPWRSGQLEWLAGHVRDGGRGFVACLVESEKRLIIIPCPGAGTRAIPLGRLLMPLVSDQPFPRKITESEEDLWWFLGNRPVS